MFIFPVVALVSGVVGVRILWNMTHPDKPAAVVEARAGQSSQKPARQSDQAQSQGSGPMTTGEYLAAYTPRIAGLDYTSPAYDQLTQPKRVPVPAACVTMKTKCQCYTQQGTKLQVNADQCGQIVRDGFFMAFDPDGDQPRHQVDQPKYDGGQQLAATGRPVDPISLEVFDRGGR